MNKKIFISTVHSHKEIEALKSISGIEVFLSETECPERYFIPSDIVDKINIIFCEALPENFLDMKSLEFIQLSSTGYSQVFNYPLCERGIKVCNGRGEFDVPIAEWAISMIINLHRSLPQMMYNQERGIWDRSAKFQTEIRGKTLGLFGYGSILNWKGS